MFLRASGRFILTGILLIFVFTISAKENSGDKAESVSSTTKTDSAGVTDDANQSGEAWAMNNGDASEATNSGTGLPQWLLDLKHSEAKTQNTDKNNRSAKHISQIIKMHNKTITECYHRYLKQHPDVAGKLQVRLRIDSGGCVDSVEVVHSTLDDNDFCHQVCDMIRAWDNFGPADCGDKIYRQEYIFGDESQP
ncbi:AgmX/PglI C-terminal domain-containing protein [candidate division KSB1 bacterium]|nr:AgmX/PglI C-terminal domain-containing protein [candidate division KSB1 bacterium]